MSKALRDLWQHRELLFLLTQRDIKIRYKQAALGAAWIEVARRQTLHEFPDTGAPTVVDDARAKVSDWFESRRAASAAREASAPPPASTDVASRLSSLADLHARGELTDEEYASAKAQVLAGN